jgi:hypothetical protein
MNHACSEVRWIQRFAHEARKHQTRRLTSQKLFDQSSDFRTNIDEPFGIDGIEFVRQTCALGLLNDAKSREVIKQVFDFKAENFSDAAS